MSRASAASPPAPQTKNAALTLERSATAPISGAAIGKQPPWISVKRLMTRPRSSSDERSWSDVWQPAEVIEERVGQARA